MLPEGGPAWEQITQSPVATYRFNSLPLFLTKRTWSNVLGKARPIMMVANLGDEEFSRRQAHEVPFCELVWICYTHVKHMMSENLFCS